MHHATISRKSTNPCVQTPGSRNGTTNVLMETFGQVTKGQSAASLGGILLSIIARYSSNFQRIIEGRDSPLLSTTESNELFGGARISYIFNDVFAAKLMELDPFDNLSDEEIRVAIYNANGPRPSVFIPELSFDLLAKKQISRLEPFGIECMDAIFEELQRILLQNQVPEFIRFPELRNHIIDVANRLLRKSVGTTQNMISNLIKIELAYINTSHPDFIGGSKAVGQLVEKFTQQNTPSFQELQTKVAPPITQRTNPPNLNDRTVPSQQQTQQINSENIRQSSGIINLLFGPKQKSPDIDVIDHKNRDYGIQSNYIQKQSSSFPQLSDPVLHLPMVPDSIFPPSSKSVSDRDKIETEIIKSLISSYFDIVRKNFLDLVPKTVMSFLVNHITENLQNELVSSLYKEDKLGELLKETDDIAQRRIECQELYSLLQEAFKIINDVREYSRAK